MMINDGDLAYEILAKGKLVMLRSRDEADRAHYMRWQTQGEWREFDAPWELTTNKENKAQKKSRKQTTANAPEVTPQKMAVIATLENRPLGWVNRYRFRDSPRIWFVGIDICEDDYLNRGCGTEALSLWVDYLFENGEFHKLCLDTWSLNPRMMRVAEKIGFIYEGSQREMQLWQEEWLDFVHYGMLRTEWEARK